MNWENIVERVTPYIVKIDTPTGSGTGFLCGYSEDRHFCCIATALHVVSDTDEWQQPMKIHSNNFDKEAFLKESERVIFTDYKTDSAVIFTAASNFDFPNVLVPLRSINTPISIGSDVGWLGYPAIASYTLCFFSGSVSARREDRSAYFIDGVAINGVSGGPVVYSSETLGVEFVGIVSAYQANRHRGDALPGLLFAHDVSHFHNVIQQVKSMDEAKKKKPELESAQMQSLPESHSPAEQRPTGAAGRPPGT